MTMHENMNLLDFAGPLEVLNHAQHDLNNPGMFAFATPLIDRL
jgi:hypothetical protein